MNGIVTIKQGGRLIGRVSFKRPSYKNVSESYMEIFPPKDAAVDPVFFAYTYIGGEVNREHDRDYYAYANACALRISYALNMAGAIIPEKMKVLPVTKKSGKRILRGGSEYIVNGANYYYIYSVSDLVTALEFFWGKADKSIAIVRGVSQLQNLMSMNKKGIIVFYISGFSDATGHVTIWDGHSCLDGSTYYEPDLHPKQTLTYIKFWELK
ncbi:hypothetical protein SNQ23_002498 [Cronobacter dublinensis]|uniref:T6SS effector amidase Tae4 family protein n=2 Tax=Cronobacter dublinensis TaxID=413497 RepID=UPI000CFC455A|nr:T6SS effector amidase Tae4 family protein [Cronobacter dublinensis]ELY6212657.1 hypothetical protein [Cronobacter dublinensis]EMD9247166.1 hypothetical protein [Cronobacter dublinensis]MDI6444745.1 T6SS effector amidase Tae4 family protein [Cronobacter dublinensis]MDK1193771.1 T6SS effector amidase Tae4 family protein [Cronobacter dublinensis]MDK1197050.1 T6SS effector amidase Tae4 family protein [Cronobacter dublinensis]